MPGMSGEALASALANDHPGVWVVIVTASTVSTETARWLRRTGVTCILKPFTPGALMKEGRQVIGR
jgi:CheY-like chemotaxis protein